jgi:predicted TIM-barrel fold metal-dependent hydrolase
MQQTGIRFLSELAGFLERNGTALVADADTHITDIASISPALRERYDSSPNYYHGRPISVEDLLCEMEMARVDAALSWQNPATTHYTADLDANAERLLAANRYVHLNAVKYLGRIIPGGWTDPKACGVDGARRIAEVCVREFGFPFVKMNPAQNAYPIDSPDVLAVLDNIVELGAVPAFHFGADTPFTPAEGLEKLLLRYPGHPILAIHMGGGGAGYLEAEGLYAKARLLGLKYPNLHYALSAKRDAHIESDLITYQLAGEPFSGNLSCASDAPYGRLTWNFGGYRWMFRSLQDGARHTDKRLRLRPDAFNDAAVGGYLGGNLVRLTMESCRRLVRGGCRH